MLTALFTSSDRQLDTKERRRYELKLSKAPNMRTVIIALLAIFVIASGLTALGAEIKVTDVASLQACVSGNAIPAGSSSPDVGRTAGPGDTCVVFDGVYNVPAQLVVSVENLIVRSMNGATATIIQGNVNGALINIIVRGVTFGGPAADQGFTVTNTDGGGGIAICVTQAGVVAPCNVPAGGFVITPAGAGIAQENITIQNNRFLNNGEEGVVFFYNPPSTTAIDTIRILNNEFRQNGGSGLVFGSTVGAIGRRGLDRNVVIDGNTFDVNVQADAANFPNTPAPNDCDLQPANIHFCNTGTIEQVGIVNNKIFRAGTQTAPIQPADGITFDQGIIEIRDMLIDRNVIHQNTRNGIKFDYAGRLGENVVISNNAQGSQGITQNGPAPAQLPAEGNGIYITSRVTEVRGVQFVNNVINGNRGQYQGAIAGCYLQALPRRQRHQHGELWARRGRHLGRQRLPPELQQRRLHRQPRRLHALHGLQQQVPQQRLRRAHRGGCGSTGALRRRLRGLPRFHRGEPRLRCSGH
jgi:hypothetical protein